MNARAMARTQRIVATKRASSDSGEDSSFDEGISSLFALGRTPSCEAAPLLKNRLQCYREASKEWAVDSLHTASRMRQIQGSRIGSQSGKGQA